ncbi:MAG: winged helix-turn-helix transcriptional regulator [Candidatus Aenigmarchaeota archaeon]|nr:winged helix-turn-helix transcriptional regulator [Candidatus Aenigmarchaeota archaeon]
MPEILDKNTIKALGAETRQDIVKLLAKRPYTASELATLLRRHVTTVSEHLNVLEQSGLVSRKESTNKWVYYGLTPKGEKLFKPSYYSWVIVFSLSLLSLVVGISRIFQGFSASPASMPREASGKTLADAVNATSSVGTSGFQADATIGVLFILFALLGFSYLILKQKKIWRNTQHMPLEAAHFSSSELRFHRS